MTISGQLVIKSDKFIEKPMKNLLSVINLLVVGIILIEGILLLERGRG